MEIQGGQVVTVTFAPSTGGSYMLFFAVAGTKTGGAFDAFDVPVTVD